MSPPREPPFKVRRSKIHGNGAFATRRIRKGMRVAEYVGERISHQAANRRYEDGSPTDNHTFLFTVDRYLVIDGGVRGSDVRFINHSCDPNLESTIEDRRVFLDAIRTIEKGQELSFDYQIGRDKDDPKNVDEIYACRCGAEQCRGTMLWPAKRPKPARRRTQSPVAARRRSAPRTASAARSRRSAR